MAVTKTSLVSVLVVLAITYNQGAARPANGEQSDLTQNELSSIEDSGSFKSYMLPTAMEKGLAITINGTIDTNHKWFIVELPSISGKASCRIELNYIDGDKIYITPALDGTDESEEYGLNVTPGSSESLSFSLTIVARVDKQNNDILGMTFWNEDVGPSSQLICKIKNFNDINQIVIKSGVDNVDSLLFEFE